RPLSELRSTPTQPERARHGLLNQSAARAVAAATSALLIATLVINRSGQAFDTEGTAAAASISAGTIAIFDDDQGQSLFDLSAMVPGHSEVRCLEIVYEGTIVPVELSLKTNAPGELASYLDVIIDEGSGGSFETCAGFVPSGSLFNGTLRQLSDQGRLELDRLFNSGARNTFRVRFDLQDDARALGQSTAVEFIWEATPS
ncbi:MAG: hypothetical protein GY939_17415, partial [Actinomycetia bacterium]|nr:hypothetical protein [Actinomycetes bacterium]